MSPKVTTDESKGSGKGRYNVAQTNVRQQAARAVRIVFTALAVILALGAILVVLRGNINEQNAIVKFITDVADAVSGPFSLNDGIFDFSGQERGRQERPGQLGDRGDRLPGHRAGSQQRDRPEERYADL